MTFADRFSQECSSDHNQNQRPKGHQDPVKAGLKCGLVEEVRFDGSHPCQRAWIDEDVAQRGYYITPEALRRA